MSLRRVVITGLGLVTPLGVGSPHNWQQLTNGVSGIQSLTPEAYLQLPCRVAGLVPRGENANQLNVNNYISSSEQRTMTKSTLYSLVAAEEALKDSELTSYEDKCLERIGVSVGTGMVDLDDIVNAGKFLERSYSRISPYFVPRILPNMPAGQISMKYNFQGPNHAVSTACATGCHAIGDAFRMIKNNDADVMICGGTEASVSPLGIAGFCRLRALSTKFNETPEIASRPFDSKRDGFVMGEGAGILVIEEYEHALKRRTKMYGEILGYGMSGDAYHMTAPRNDGKGAISAMKGALNEAGLTPNQIGYINAHATSTPLGDEIEVEAIKKVFGNHAQNISISSTKGAVGHLLGAAGAVETIFTVIACHASYLPPTINLDSPSDGLDLDFVPNEAKLWEEETERKIAMNNSFGFGGTNACLCIGSIQY